MFIYFCFKKKSYEINKEKSETTGAIHSTKISDRSDREKWSTSKGGPFFSKLLRLDRTDPLSFGPKFPEILLNGSRPTTLVDGTLDDASRQFCPGIYVAFVTLLTYPVSTCATEGSFNGMKGLKKTLFEAL